MHRRRRVRGKRPWYAELAAQEAGTLHRLLEENVSADLTCHYTCTLCALGDSTSSACSRQAASLAGLQAGGLLQLALIRCAALSAERLSFCNRSAAAPPRGRRSLGRTKEAEKKKVTR